MFTLAIDLIVGVAPPERAGAASAIAETAAEFGGAVGIAVFGSIGVAIYRGAMATGVPAAIPLESAQAARDTLGGAIAVARQLPDVLGGALVDAARAAFVQGVHVSAALSALGAICLAVFVAVLLRGVGGGWEPEGAATEDVEVEPSAAS